ncbi:MAG: SDR family NAD(P)-dependent oxidoreductase [Myxococcales bacterium]|nr:SDR family NAD(P)-dependent oxidoreductase [Myxococcales bacterium]
MDLHGLTALVTGASSGIGRATATALHRLGAHVVLVSRRQERLDELVAALGERATALVLDVRDPAAVAALADHPQLREVALVINAAGLALGLDPVAQASLVDWDTMIETNCKALVHVTRAMVPGMVERRRGHVVHIGSVAGTYPYPAGHVYGATKAFVHQFSQAMKSDLAGTGVRVTCIEPGMVETEFSVVRFAGDRERADKVYQGMQPLTADDIADLVVFAVTRPAHVNVNIIEVMPEAQGFGPFLVKRAPG